MRGECCPMVYVTRFLVPCPPLLYLADTGPRLTVSSFCCPHHSSMSSQANITSLLESQQVDLPHLNSTEGESYIWLKILLLTIGYVISLLALGYLCMLQYLDKDLEGSKERTRLQSRSQHTSKNVMKVLQDIKVDGVITLELDSSCDKDTQPLICTV